jgi:lysophospholipase L1-like esterase
MTRLPQLQALLMAAVGALASAAPLSATAADFAATRPTPRIEYWQQRQATIDAQVADSARMAAVKLLFVGDSITDFWLLDDNPWVEGQKCGRQVWDQSFAKPGTPNYALNIGISGDRMEHLLYRLQPNSEGGLGQLDSPELQPDFIVLMIGINNTWAPEHPVADSVYAGVEAVVKALHERRPRARIILQSLLPTQDEAKNASVVRPVNARLQALLTRAPYAQYSVWLDLYPGFVDAKGQQVSTDFNDGLHPNAAGYRVWRDLLVPFLDQQRAQAKP